MHFKMQKSHHSTNLSNPPPTHPPTHPKHRDRQVRAWDRPLPHTYIQNFTTGGRAKTYSSPQSSLPSKKSYFYCQLEGETEAQKDEGTKLRGAKYDDDDAKPGMGKKKIQETCAKTRGKFINAHKRKTQKLFRDARPFYFRVPSALHLKGQINLIYDG